MSRPYSPGRFVSRFARPSQRNSLAPTRLRVGWTSRLALRPTIPARERFYAEPRPARRGNAAWGERDLLRGQCSP
jgi:hypothetical protein